MNTQSIANSWNLKSWWRATLLDWDRLQLFVSLVIVFLLGLSPLLTKQPYVLGVIILTVVYAYVGITWNIVVGFAGQMLLAHLNFLAFGAFTAIILKERFGITPWIGLFAGALVAGLLGWIIAKITLRYGLKMDYFALFTIALMTAFGPLISRWDLAGGASGIGVSYKGVSFMDMTFVDKAPYLYIALVILLIGIIIQYKLYRSKMGKYFLAIRENEDAAATLGVDLAKYKTLAVVISAMMAGFGGGFYVMYVTFIDAPQIFNLAINLEIVMVAPLIGGLGTLIGPIIGSLINKPLAELLRVLFMEQLGGSSLVVYGLFLMLVILFLPHGITKKIYDGPYTRLQRRLLAEQGELSPDYQGEE